MRWTDAAGTVGRASSLSPRRHVWDLPFGSMAVTASIHARPWPSAGLGVISLSARLPRWASSFAFGERFGCCSFQSSGSSNHGTSGRGAPGGFSAAVRSAVNRVSDSVLSQPARRLDARMTGKSDRKRNLEPLTKNSPRDEVGSDVCDGRHGFPLRPIQHLSV